MVKKIVIAIGGNSLIKNSKQSPEFQEQLETINETSENIAEIVKQGYKVVITHGNGPQVGDVLIRSFLTRNHLPEIPLDIANAITQGEIGYLIQQTLKNALLRRKCNVPIATIITQVIVDKNDPAFRNYTKPVGTFYSKKEAFALQSERKWAMREDAGRGYRRLVSSPEPKAIVEIEIIRKLLDSDAIVITGGGGGIPVFQRKDGSLFPTAAVIDKDLTSSLLATLIDADVLLISTGIDRVYLNYSKPNQKPITQMTAKQAKKYYEQGHFGSGSMGPKILAGIKFIGNKKSRQVVITDPNHLTKALINKNIGTRIVK